MGLERRPYAGSAGGDGPKECVVLERLLTEGELTEVVSDFRAGRLAVLIAPGHLDAWDEVAQQYLAIVNGEE